MKAIEPEMVLGKAALGGDGKRLGEIVDVGLYHHRAVKFLVVRDADRRVPARRIAIESVSSVSPDTVHVRT